ncbi:MAG TPA: c-type cytochrome [Bryobacteraceae bacterium]|nr:c-type cytochrome [Bryobacteraceae bacterium]
MTRSVLLVALVGVALAQAPVKPAAKTVLDGVYSAAQAQRGKATFDKECATCHAATLEGFSGPPLKGRIFMDRWREFNLDVLFENLRTTMPKDFPGTLTEAAYLDVLAYILEANEIPASPRELTVDAVKTTRLVGKEGHKALPSSSPVSAIGCLVLDSGNGWFLTKATEPERTLDDEISAAELKAAKDEPLGDLLFRLQDITDIPDFDPDALRDHKVETKGILVLQPGNLRINVSSLKVVAAECEP